MVDGRSWRSGVSAMTFLVKVADLAATVSIATMARHVVEDADPFSLCMNEWSRSLLHREVSEEWTPYHFVTAESKAYEYHLGRPITIVAELPDGLVLGGD